MPISMNAIEGLASNLNTTDIINATITLERIPASLAENRQGIITKELSTFTALSAKILALKVSLVGISSRSALTQSSITISDDSFMSATAEGEISAGTYTLDILSLARNHQIASQGFSTASDSIFGTGTITLALGNQSPTTITIDENSNSLIGVKKAINDANIGISASIINDGTSSNPYRLLLTGSKTGSANVITVTTSLSGGSDLILDSGSFDAPEVTSFSSQATSVVTLAATASYSGSTNKDFIFTIVGSGSQTVGNGNITINWVDSTDPDNTGSIVVDQADKTINGPEGLKLSFADGDLVAGDTFRVTGFAPLLQVAADAKISIGTNEGGASPIVISSENNSFEDVVPGLTLNVKDVTTASTGPITITTGMDTNGIIDNINRFINSYNGAMDFIDKQNEFDSDSGEGGVLLGDLTLLNVQSRMRSMVFNPILGLDKSLNTLSAIGIRTNSTGKLALKDSVKLREALENDFETFLKLFVDAGSSSSTGIEFVSASSDISGGDSFDVDITRAASGGYLQGTNMPDPNTQNIIITSSNNRVKFVVDGVVSDEMFLEERTYASTTDLVNEIQTRIDADDKVGHMGVTVEWIETGLGEGHLKMSSSAYGSSSKIDIATTLTNTAFSELGLSAATAYSGNDVEGTINGESATGVGRILTGDEDNESTAGLKLEINLFANQLVDGIDGTIEITKGLSSVISDGVDKIVDRDRGIIAAKSKGLQKQIDDIKKYVKDFDERLITRRESLFKKWSQLEVALSQIQSEGAFLESQLAGLSSNLNYMLGRR